MSAGQSSKRRVSMRPTRHYERMDARNFAEVRTCCPTSMREPHLSYCTRPGNCRDKKGYTNRDAARRAAEKMTPEQGRMVAYHCKGGCDAWHIGHPKTDAEGLEE